MRTRASAILALGLILNLTALAKQPAGAPDFSAAAIENHFQPGQLELSAGESLLFSPFIATQNRPTLNYELTEFELGIMATRVHGSSFWRGNVEVLGSVFGGGIFDGRGNYVAGATAWLHYNFVPRSGHLVPYIQAGAGGTATDLDRRIEGQAFNFNLDLSVGVRYFLSPNWSVNLEYRYQHISNDNLSSRNLGVNADGPMLSLSCFF